MKNNGFHYWWDVLGPVFSAFTVLRPGSNLLVGLQFSRTYTDRQTQPTCPGTQGMSRTSSPPSSSPWSLPTGPSGRSWSSPWSLFTWVKKVLREQKNLRYENLLLLSYVVKFVLEGINFQFFPVKNSTRYLYVSSPSIELHIRERHLPFLCTQNPSRSCNGVQDPDRSWSNTVLDYQCRPPPCNERREAFNVNFRKLTRRILSLAWERGGSEIQQKPTMKKGKTVNKKFVSFQ